MKTHNLNIKGSEIMFRTHNFGELMAFSKVGLTEIQADDLKKLLDKIELTPKQAKTRDELIAKRDAKPTLQDGGKTLVRQMFNSLVRGSEKFHVSSNGIEKGKLCENLAINRIAKVNGWGIFLNANALGEELKDDIGIGHPDAIKRSIKIGFDAKCSLSDDSFPLFQKELKDNNYIWQAKRLAMMAEFDSWYVCYSLENTPDHIIYREAKKLWYESGNDGLPSDSFVNDVKALHNYDHLPDWARVKSFEVKLTSKDIELSKLGAKLGREYFDTLMKEYLLNQSLIG